MTFFSRKNKSPWHAILGKPYDPASLTPPPTPPPGPTPPPPPPPPPPTGVTWPAATISMGVSDTFDLRTLGPTGATVVTGGSYSVDASGAPLPAGTSIVGANTLTTSGATPGILNGVVFAYDEPGAVAGDLPVLTLYGTGTSLPYMAAVYPLEGAVPSGSSVTSIDDANLRGTVLSTWPDSSAQVVVIAGETTVSGSKQIRLQAGAPAGAALTAANIDAAVSSIAFNFGTLQTITDFSTPEFVWWANAATICARYRYAITGKGQMDAVVDIHYFKGGRAFVEVTIENGKITPTVGTGTVAKPATQTYTNATVAVAGTTIATVNSPVAGTTFRGVDWVTGTWTGGHEAFRAWYCSAEVNGGAVTVGTSATLFGLAVTHDAASMQEIPFLFEHAVPVTTDLTTKYSGINYTPWSFGRVRVPEMGAGSGSEGIGPFTMPQAEYIGTGSQHAAKAVIVESLQAMGCNVRYRDSATAIPPTNEVMQDKCFENGRWPITDTEPFFERAHQPSMAIIAFMCRPSPTFIELAQGIAILNRGIADSEGQGWNVYDQGRGRAWRYRAYAQAVFLATQSAWKTGWRTLLATCATGEIGNFRNTSNPANPLALVWDYRPSEPDDKDTDLPGWHTPLWFHYYIIHAMTSIDRMKILRDANATAWATETDWVCLLPIRYVNDSQEGEWRKHPYVTRVGTLAGSVITWNANDWGGVIRTAYGVQTPEIGAFSDPVGGTNYSSYFWAALCEAVERSQFRTIAGADTAWTRVRAGLVNSLNTYKAGFAEDPQWSRWPRNKAR